MAYTTHELQQSGVYAILFPRKDMVYIGSTKKFSQRWKDHKTQLTAGKHSAKKLQNYWNKYGSIEFIFVILQTVPVDRLIEAEQMWLDAVQPFNEAGFNTLTQAYSTQGFRWSEHQKHRAWPQSRKDQFFPQLQAFNQDPLHRTVAAERLTHLHSSGKLESHLTKLAQSPKSVAQLEHARSNLKKINASLSSDVREQRRQRMIAYNAQKGKV